MSIEPPGAMLRAYFMCFHAEKDPGFKFRWNYTLNGQLRINPDSCDLNLKGQELCTKYLIWDVEITTLEHKRKSIKAMTNIDVMLHSVIEDC